MRILFLILVALVTVTGLFVENAEQQAEIVKQYVNQAIAYVQGQVEENPQQIGASAVMMTVSTVIWIGILRIVRSPSLQEIIPLPVSPVEPRESPVVVKANARNLYERLRQELVILNGRQKWMTEETKNAREQLTQAHNNRLHAETELRKAKETHDEASKRLDKLLEESDEQQDEITAIELELERLKKLI